MAFEQWKPDLVSSVPYTGAPVGPGIGGNIGGGIARPINGGTGIGDGTGFIRGTPMVPRRSPGHINTQMGMGPDGLMHAITGFQQANGSVMQNHWANQAGGHNSSNPELYAHPVFGDVVPGMNPDMRSPNTRFVGRAPAPAPGNFRQLLAHLLNNG